ncbi:protein kinase [Corallococcus exiguus]|uniref:serine/threonine-protein kinase n=1 Tax=Corallococcus exiguus TaxID=83462 RepID=UPI001A90C803|nr:serine/threonine-protein kinase [Corallococcus exiguus]MBN8466399.1 protein kinase [Corallococcus exiguus]
MKTHRHSNPDGATLPLRKTAAEETTLQVDPLLSSQIGDFTVEERIGEGGMGVVYRATHSLIGKQAAIKVLRAELVSPRVHERLLVEARAVNAIRHPGIIDIFGFGKLPDGRPYIVMELLEGRPLSEMMSDQKRLDVPTVLWMLDQILGALGAAHRAGVVHRDLKPANVFMVEPPNAAPTIKLVDFGIAKLLENRESPTTMDGSVLGTPEFMAPEQIRGGTVGPATDLYALGIIAFQMLTGARPFQGDPVQVLFAQVDKIPPMPSSRAEGIPPELDTLVLQLLAKAPALRPPSAEAVQQQLLRIPTEARTQTFAKPPGLKPKASTQRPAPVPKPAVSRVPARAPVAVADNEDSGTETLQAIRRTPSRGWMLGGAALLVGLGAGAWWLNRPAATTEPASPPVVAESQPDAGLVTSESQPHAGLVTSESQPDAGPVKIVRVEHHPRPEEDPPEPTIIVQPIGPTPGGPKTPTHGAEPTPRGAKSKGVPPQPPSKGESGKDGPSSQPPKSPIQKTPDLPGTSQTEPTVPDPGIPPPEPPSPAPTPPTTPKEPVVPAPSVTRFDRPKLPQGTSTQRSLSKQLDTQYEALYSLSPRGRPHPSLVARLINHYQAAARTEVPSEADVVSKDVKRWEDDFKLWLADHKYPVVVAPAPTPKPAPPQPLPAKPAPPQPSPSKPAPPRPAPTGPLPTPRRTTQSEVRLANQLEKYNQEFRRRTAGAIDVAELEWQLRELHERATQDLTGTERAKIYDDMAKWLKQFETRFPL